MKVETTTIELDQAVGNGIIDITPQVFLFISRTSLDHGHMVLFCTDATGAVTTIAAEPGAADDLQNVLEKLAPRTGTYAHGRTWGTDSGYAALRASLLGPGLTLPVVYGKPTLGEDQRIVFVGCGSVSRRHTVVFQVIGESRQVRDPAIDLG